MELFAKPFIEALPKVPPIPPVAQNITKISATESQSFTILSKDCVTKLPSKYLVTLLSGYISLKSSTVLLYLIVSSFSFSLLWQVSLNLSKFMSLKLLPTNLENSSEKPDGLSNCFSNALQILSRSSTICSIFLAVVAVIAF